MRSPDRSDIYEYVRAHPDTDREKLLYIRSRLGGRE